MDLLAAKEDVAVSIDLSAAVFVVAILAMALWPAIRALSRNRRRLAAAYALAGLVVVFALPVLVTNVWEASHPDEEWSMAAPYWLVFVVSPFATLPTLLLGSWALNAAAGCNAQTPPARQTAS